MAALWQSLSALVPMKRSKMLVTCETSQASKFWLKEDAPRKVPAKFVTWEVSHAFRGWLKDSPAKKAPPKSVTLEVSSPISMVRGAIPVQGEASLPLAPPG